MGVGDVHVYNIYIIILWKYVIKLFTVLILGVGLVEVEDQL